jgi:hypothetical protein
MANVFPYEQLRSLLMEYLRDNHQGQFSSVVNGVIQLAQSKGLYQKPEAKTYRSAGGSWELEPVDFQKMPEDVRQLLWHFLVQQLIVFGKDDLHPNWPHYRVTDYGATVFSQQGPQPYDPVGFLAEFDRCNPNADDTVTSYLTEAVHAFNHDCLMAAGVMLGGASEQLVLLLVDAFETAIADSGRRSAFAQSYRWTIHSKYKALRDGLETMIANGDLPKELHDVVRGPLAGAFEHIRKIRNSAGHPELPITYDRNTLFLSLAMFGEYVSQVSRLIDHFAKHPAKP